MPIKLWLQTITVKEAVGMMQKFIHRYSDEEEKQERLLTVDVARYAMKERGKKSSKQSKKHLALSAVKERTK